MKTVDNDLHYRSYKEIANLSYDDFLDNVTELNEISSQFLDSNGKSLVFAVKKGTDSTALWKGTVRVACVKVTEGNLDRFLTSLNGCQKLEKQSHMAVRHCKQMETKTVESSLH